MWKQKKNIPFSQDKKKQYIIIQKAYPSVWAVTLWMNGKWQLFSVLQLLPLDIPIAPIKWLIWMQQVAVTIYRLKKLNLTKNKNYVGWVYQMMNYSYETKPMKNFCVKPKFNEFNIILKARLHNSWNRFGSLDW